MARPKKVIVEKQSVSEFEISLRLGDNTFTGTGVTMLEALENLEKPTKIFLKGILNMTHGEKKSKELVLTIPRIKRLFYPIARFHQAKQLEHILK